MNETDAFNTLYVPALLGALLAAIGYISKLAIEGLVKLWTARQERKRKLQELEGLLEASNGIFQIQNSHAKRLFKLLGKKHSDMMADLDGFENTFSCLHSKFNDEERELHGLIRSITRTSMKKVNHDLAEWLRNDRTYKTALNARGNRGKLARLLRDAELHLALWEAKYEYWIPNNPKHALVYLDDEAHHGVPFPKGAEKIVAELLGQNAAKNSDQHSSHETKDGGEREVA
jgi:hypothetical protein